MHAAVHLPVLSWATDMGCAAAHEDFLYFLTCGKGSAPVPAHLSGTGVSKWNMSQYDVETLMTFGAKDVLIILYQFYNLSTMYTLHSNNYTYM